MIIETIVTPILFVLIIGFIVIQLAHKTKPSNFPPGPSKCPVIGSSMEVSKLDKTIPVAYNKLAEIYGPLTGLYIGESLAMLVNGYDVIKEVLSRKEFNARPPMFNVFMKIPTDSANKTGIMCNNSKSWNDQKSIAKEFMESLFKADSSFEEEIRLELEDLVMKLNTRALAQDNMIKGFPVMEVLKPHVIRFIWFLLTGTRLTDTIEVKEIGRLAESFRTADPLLLIMTHHSSLRCCPYFCGIWRSNMAAKSRIRKILKGVVDGQRINKSVKGGETDSGDSKFMDFIKFYSAKMNRIPTEDGTGGSYNTMQLIETTNDLFGAGAETTSNYLSYAVLYMALYPEIQDKVIQEIDYVIGLEGVPKLGDRDRMPYTMAVAEEVLRLSGPVPVSAPHANPEETKFHGYTIPKDTLVVLNYYSAHMDEGYFGDPENFRPGRFLDDENKFISRDRVFPFGFGPRACPGESLARATFFMFFVALLQHFDIEQVEDSVLAPSTIPDKGLTMAPKPFNVVMRPRINDETETSCKLKI